MNLLKIKHWLNLHRFAMTVASFWFAFGSWFYLHALQKRPDGWYFGHGNVWSDWSLHVSQVSRFAYTAPQYWFTSTYFSGGKLTYPFVSNLISGVLVRLELGYPLAMIGPSLLFWVATLLVLFWFGSWILGSSRQAALAVTLFFCSAGLGILRIFGRPSWFSELTNLSRDYTQFTQYEWGTGSLFLGMFLPQRAFLLGFWIALLCWGIWLRSLDQKNSMNKWRGIVLAGLGAGCLPIIHMHSFLAIILLSIPVALVFYDQRLKEVLLFAAAAATVSIPLYLIFISGGIQIEFFHFRVGWTAHDLLDWLNQWLWQWGAMLLLAGVGLWRLRGKLSLLRWTVLSSFWFLFVVANIIQFQPVAWDNTKLFLWVYWGLSLASAGFLAQLWRQGIGKKIAVASLFIVLTMTGAAELWRSSHLDHYTYQATSQEEFALAEKIRHRTSPDAVFATASLHNHWVTMWAARPVVMGYSTWVWNFGYDYQERERDLTALFQNPERRQEIIEKYGIDFIVMGPEEWQFFRANTFTDLPIFAESLNTKVYKVSSQ